jgi:hypothetical protein
MGIIGVEHLIAGDAEPRRRRQEDPMPSNSSAKPDCLLRLRDDAPAACRSSAGPR